jgi:hypothetical protein
VGIRDTKAIGIHDSMMESGMGSKLGRVKEDFPDIEVTVSQAERDSARSMGV